jgi:hypothetical protein
MCCALLVAAGLGPRLAVLLVWIFGDRVQQAFDWWGWAFLGLLFLPWTTLAYLLVWQRGGISGAEWIVVAIGFAIDIATYSARAAKGRTAYY